MEAQAEQPSFLVIQCDDLGVGELGINNSLVHTPHLDALAAESVRFSDFTVNPVCAPSRATFLTGRHFLRTGVSHVHGGKDFLHLDERTLADHFRAAGYATGMWGKWHSGHTEGYFPWQRGFDEAWMCQLYRHREARGFFNGQPNETSKWADEGMADYAIDFLQRNRANPFFAYLPSMTPHSPHDAPARWVEFYTDQGHSEALAKLWGMVSYLDEQLGRVLATLDELNLSDSTVVVFMSDNGAAIDVRSLSDEDRDKRKIGGLRGWKGDLYENGVRSPLFIRWPGRLIPMDVTENTDSVDLAPTLLDMVGINPVPEALPMEGRSFFPRLLSQNQQEHIPTVINYAHRGWLTSGPPYSLDGLPNEYKPVTPEEKALLDFEKQSLSIRQGHFKLIINPDYQEHQEKGVRFLVDLQEDPGEQNNVADKFPERVKEMESALRDWWEKTKESPHGFASPVFHLRKGNNRIPTNAPSRVAGGVFNNVLELKGWSAPGDSATFRIASPQATEATLRIRWKGDEQADAQWTISIAGNEVPLLPDQDEPTLLALPGGEFDLEIKLASLPEGETLPPMRALEITLP